MVDVIRNQPTLEGRKTKEIASLIGKLSLAHPFGVLSQAVKKVRDFLALTATTDSQQLFNDLRIPLQKMQIQTGSYSLKTQFAAPLIQMILQT